MTRFSTMAFKLPVFLITKSMVTESLGNLSSHLYQVLFSALKVAVALLRSEVALTNSILKSPAPVAVPVISKLAANKAYTLLIRL